jgi:hypothetical protein
MSSVMKPWILFVAAAVPLGVLSLLMAQDKPEAKKAEPEELRLSRAQVGIFRVKNAETGEDIERLEHPLLRYTDPAREDSNGTLWAWGRKGRPVAVLELLKHSDWNFWVQAFHATDDTRLKMTAPGRPVWTPKSSDLKFQPFLGAPAPAETAVVRLRQMKEFAQKFSAHEFWEPQNSRFELRLLAQPVHRYDDAEKGIIDGTLFIIAHGTNPEATLFIEAAKEKDQDATRWRFGIGRSSQAELVILYDDKEVYHEPRIPFQLPTDNPVWLVN